MGYRYVANATDLRGLNGGQPLLGLFKGSANPAPASNGIATASDVNMDVAYDKLGLQRPASEPTTDLGDYPDQPMLDLMTQKAIEVLSGGPAPSPFILMVEGASIDKQSHSNQAAGTIWDTIEFDKAVGVARAWAAKRSKDTLIVVTADHDQSMSIIGVSNVPDSEYFDRSKGEKVTYKTSLGIRISPCTAIPSPTPAQLCPSLIPAPPVRITGASQECQGHSPPSTPQTIRHPALTRRTPAHPPIHSMRRAATR
jgi:alkaline phosphatase